MLSSDINFSLKHSESERERDAFAPEAAREPASQMTGEDIVEVSDGHSRESDRHSRESDRHSRVSDRHIEMSAGHSRVSIRAIELAGGQFHPFAGQFDVSVGAKGPLRDKGVRPADAPG